MLAAYGLLPSQNLVPDEVKAYLSQYAESEAPSRSVGSPGKGKLENGKLLPFIGPNYFYFDVQSYISGRAFLNGKLRKVVLDTYAELYNQYPDRHWGMMETGYETGGPITFHNTHQNGLSMDFMTPLLKNGEPYAGLDNLGALHYLLEFDEKGRLLEDPTITIDFEGMAHHIEELEKQARQQGMKIEKVILKLNLKQAFFATEKGKQLKAKGVYFAQNLPKAVDDMHDDHYHIDFAVINP